MSDAPEAAEAAEAPVAVATPPTPVSKAGDPNVTASNASGTVVLADAVKHINAAKAETKKEVVESDDFIDAIYRGMAARTHVYVHGVGGVGKTYGTEIMARHFGVPTFYVQLRPDSKREELFGPLSMKALQQDSYEHVVAGYMPEAVLVNLDELRDAGRFLRQMLGILNERWFVNGHTRLNVPLRTAVGTTNEPIDDTDTHLEALLDRFPQRLEQKPIATSKGFKTVLKDAMARDIEQATGVSRAASYTVVQPEELIAITDAVLTCTVGDHIITLLDDLRKNVKKELEAPRSPRRWIEGLRNAKAEAVLAGRTHLVETDLRVLKLMLPNHPDEYKIANQLCANFRDKVTEAIEESKKGLAEIRKMLEPQKDAVAKGEGADFSLLTAASKATRELLGKIEEGKKQLEADGRPTDDLDKVIADIKVEEDFMQRAVLGR